MHSAFKNQAGTTAGVVVSSSACWLDKLIINTGAASAVVTLYDGTVAAGTLIGTFQGVTSIVYPLDINCKRGLSLVVAAGAADVTVTFS